ncbi:hypothetical protein ST47_g4713 [Ascochyta rabiei]|uniref:Uncharacterized protein n=1 Tax=Didymella rabiei TaxID=5454 RepID=A0A163F414_DIDRA|nr:hypothetical protein ST47_g4713 [Ascochyta rabiei]
MGCAKISISLLIRKLFTGRLFEYTSIILALFTSGWTISGILVTAFQCRLPNPWDILKRDHCIDIAAFGNFLASINIATEVLLVLVPLAVWTRGTSVGNRLYVSATFFSRLSIIAAVSAQLYYFNASTSSSPTPDSWNTTLCMQIAQTLSVASACLPGLHPLVAKDMSCTASSLYAQTDPAKRWDVKKFGSLSSHSSHPSTDPSAAFEPVTSPYCRPLATHGLVRSPPSCDAYFSPLVFASTTPAAPNNVFNRLVGASDAPSTSPFIDQDPLGIPNNAHQLGYLPSTPDWEEDEESGTTRPQRRPSSDYVFYRSKVISVAEGGLLGAGEEGRRFVPPLPSPRMGRGARTF